MLPTYITTLCSGPIPGIVAGSPGWSYSRQVDAGKDHRHPILRNPFFFDHHPLNLLSQDDHRRRVLADGPLQGHVDPEAQPSTEPVALVFLAEQGMELVDHRPAIAATGKESPVGSSVMLGMHEVERKFAVNPGQSADPGPRVKT